MAKGFGGTMSGTGNASSTRLGGGSGSIKSNDFPANLKMSQFSGNTYDSGGTYTAETKDGYKMVIDTSNGYNSEVGSSGTTYTVSVVKGNKTQQISNGFVEATAVTTTSFNRVDNNNRKEVVERLNKSMPYFVDRAKYWKDKL